MNSKFTKHLSRVLRIIITFFLSTLFMLVTSYLKNDDLIKESSSTYEKRELYEELDKLSKKPVVIMAHINDGVNIMYFTKHSVVGVPYHRQAYGITASYKIMEGKYKEDEAKEILRKTNSSYIFIRKSNQKSVTKNDSLAQIIINGFENKLNKNSFPSWISFVNFPKKFNDIIVAKINRRLLQK